MRILMISKACLVGTYQRKLEEIARFQDIELMVIVPPSWRDGSRSIRLERVYTAGYQLIVEPIALNGSFHLHFYPRLERRLRAFAPDIVHIDEEPYNLATFHALRLAKRVGARALWFTWQNLNRRYPLPFRLIERYNLNHADYGIVGSAGAAAVWREKGYSGPLAVIPQFGVDPDIYKPSGDEREPSPEFRIGYVGRLVPEKGIDLLLEAVATLDKEGWRLTIVGAGPEKDRLAALAHHLGLPDRVLVLPSRSQPNWTEQFGRVLIEAMACGVPVVGSDCGEIPNVVGKTGLIFPEGDAAALRACLEQLRDHADLRASLAQRGRERVLTHFTQTQVARHTVTVYREMMNDQNDQQRNDGRTVSHNRHNLRVLQ
jgi:glycosyltransferase involved in cell wall biosynthesis